MEITPHCVVALTWTLKDSLGDTLDELQEPVEFLVGSDDLLPAISAALQGHEPGAVLDLNLEPEDAFGDFDEQLVFLARRNELPAGIEEGMLLDAAALPREMIADAPPDAIFTITELYPEHAVLDANHPLAGMALRLHLKVQAVREPNDEELERGSAGTGFFRLTPAAPGSDSVH
ncbi:peptidylprolyl isomerase [Ottowia sp.]|uniref:FKBP-type peptidyl-prolyl cis-trans isomerase n=1 Tax=Ottowia sp. TaxID=1898956 RepID=UPI002CD45EDD|nr:peptidylprolyl isomerase [Ottowia sp.]HOB66549.1 FKBP-type peptidyl-prolyl cis-trans isomerase [Ottowia sp.]HPZ58070.1 FKBP-type peptidyl-prolyl cis-trans isomerase [Ottowia sp.]HQD49086.1 FKBP-type peptidyl-prolyl cis-trans isomerase [Ottowia sp.]